MGFTISNYSLYGLPPVNIYVSIHGSYSVKKAPNITTICIEGLYHIAFTVYYSTNKDNPVITQKDMSFNLQELPEPANIYTVIYNEIKKDIGSQYSITSNASTPEQTLTFTDD